MKVFASIGILGLVLAIGAAVFFEEFYVPHATGPVAQQALVLKPAWSKELYQTLGDHGSAFDELIVAAGEISDTDHGPDFVLNPVDYAWLAQHGLHVGFLVNIDALATNSDASAALASCAKTLQERSAGASLHPAEFILDYQCPPQRIGDLQRWIKPLRANSIPITVTGSPTLLKLSAFSSLAKSTGSFVLHEDDGGPDVSADVMRRDVERAARIGVPFRLQLRSFIQPAEAHPSADPAQMAQLLHDLTSQHPILLQAIIWNNLSSDNDPETWPWATLKAVMTGVNPSPSLQVVVRHLETGVNEIDVVNKGTGDGAFNSKVSVTWNDADLVDTKPLPDFEHAETGRRSMVFTPLPSLASHPIRAGEQRGIGWLRLSDDSPIQAIVVP